jgi:hypothetical protein
MATVRELVVSFGFDVDDAPLQKMESALDEIKSGLLAIGAAAVGAAASLFGIAKSTADAADAIKDTSIALGINYDSLQRLGYAAQMSGASQEMLADGLRFLSKAAMDTADSNSEASKAFRALGISARDSTGKLRSPDALLVSMADAFKKLPPGAEKSAMAMQFFGRSGNQLVQFLNEGSDGIRALGAEAESLGFIMDTAAVEAGGAFNDELDRLSGVAKGIARSIGTGLIPVIMDLMVAVRQWVLSNREILKSRIQAFVEVLSKFLQQLWRVSMAVWQVFRALVIAIDSVAKSVGGFTGVLSVLAGVMGLFALGRLGVAIFDVAKGFLAIGRAAVLAWRSALLGPILIGAAVVAAFLVIEDLIAFLDGRPSVLGFLLKNKDQILATLFRWFERVKEIGYKAIRALTVGFLEFFGIPRAEAERAFDSFANAVEGAVDLAISALVPLGEFLLSGIGVALDGLILLAQGVSRAFVAIATDPRQALTDFASTIGDVVKGAFLSLFDVALALRDRLMGALAGIGEAILGAFSRVRDVLAAAVEGIASSFLSMLGAIGERIRGAIIDPVKAAVADAFGFLRGKFGTLAAKLGIDLGSPEADAQTALAQVASVASSPFPNISPAATVAAPSVGGAVTMESTINVTVPPGTDAAGVGEAVRQAAAEEFQKILRPAARATVPGVFY